MEWYQFGLTNFQEHQYDSPVHVCVACHVIQRIGWGPEKGGGGGGGGGSGHMTNMTR